MNLAEHIKQKIFAPRLNDKRILVVYDAENRYQEICQSLASQLCTVIITEKKPVSSRMEAMSSWQALLRDTTNQSQLVIHCSEKAPNDDEKRHHPFASYAALGASFPSKASDEYSEICRIFLPDRVTEINQLFEAEEPPAFDLIDNLLSGSHAHPHLQSIYDTADLSQIIPRFLVPRLGCEDIEKSLLESNGWVQELRQTVERTLGLSLNAKITNPDTIRKKLWSYLLFSEFAADLPLILPTNLADIPHGSGGHITFIRSLCVDLRKHSDTKDAYRENADEVENNLNLASECQDIHELGNTDTFSFEEKNFLHTACIAIRSQQLNKAKDILEKHQHSLWAEEGERSLLWRILELALDTLAHIIQSKSVHLKNAGSSGAQLCDTYRDEVVKVDKVFRELESATAQLVECEDEILEIIEEVRAEYREHFNLLQQRFLRDVEREGWPFESMNSNNSTYTRLVAPALRSGKRVVYFHVDALRLDLAKDICQSIIGHKAQLTTTCAQLPCVTKFAMASLLPDAENELKFVESNEVLIPMLKDKSVATRSERMATFSSVLSDRVQIYNLETFISDTKTPKKRKDFVKKKPHDLLVVTSTEIDEQGEGASSKSLQFLPDIMRDLKLAIERCGDKDLNYDVAVIATDHGFIWAEDMGVDSTVVKPPGSWSLKKRRCLIGSGDNCSGTVKLDTNSIGIPTDLPSFIIPKALATFAKGSGYFHEGLSLQESLLPQIVVSFEKSNGLISSQTSPDEIEINRKKSTVASRIVSMNISWPGTPDMLAEPFQLKLVAIQKNVEIGFPISSDNVDSISGFVSLKQGESTKVSLKLGDATQEGAIKVKAINPQTDKTLDTFDLNYKPTVF